MSIYHKYFVRKTAIEHFGFLWVTITPDRIFALQINKQNLVLEETLVLRDNREKNSLQKFFI